MAAADPHERPMVEHALEYLARGYPVFAVCSPKMGQHYHGQHRCANPGKTPLVAWAPFQERLPTDDEVRSWWSRWPDANIGMATGVLSGILVLDADGTEARKACLQRGGLDRTPTVWTGKVGGAHFHLEYPGGDIRNFARRLPGTDMRAQGGYVLLPPSVHASGNVYRWADNTRRLPHASVPGWLLELIHGHGDAENRVSSGDPLDVEVMLHGFDEGTRDTGLFKLACRLRHDDTPQGVAEALIATAARNCRPPFDVDEAVAKVRYVYRKYDAGNVGPTLEDDGWFAPPGQASADPSPDPPPSTVFFRPISELLAMEEVEPDWLVDQLFTAGSNGWVAAEPKVGKSWTVLELVYALATGQPFLGRFFVKQPRRTLYLQEEDSVQRVLRRFKKILKGDSSRTPPSDEYLRWSVRAGFKLDNLAWIELLRQEIESFDAEVVVLDVFNRLHGSDENKQQEMTAILNTLTSLTNRYGCSFIIVHHNRKPQAGGEARANQLMRGSGVLAGWAECSLYLRKSTAKHTFIVTPESKDAPEIDDFTVKLIDLENGGILLEVGSVSPQERVSKLDGDIVKAVEKLTQDGLDATVQRIADAVGRERSGVSKRLKALVEDGILEEDEVQMGRVWVKLYRNVTL